MVSGRLYAADYSYARGIYAEQTRIHLETRISFEVSGAICTRRVACTIKQIYLSCVPYIGISGAPTHNGTSVSSIAIYSART